MYLMFYYSIWDRIKFLKIVVLIIIYSSSIIKIIIMLEFFLGK